MKKVLTVVVVTLLAGVAVPGTHLGAESRASIAAGPVKVTIHYKGKGTIDASHKLWVWLFDTPDIGPQAMPIDQLTLEANGTEAAFEGVVPSQVWIAAAFDEKGVMTGNEPPPTGTPIGILMGSDGMPTAVTPGPKGTVVLTFDDSIRMP